MIQRPGERDDPAKTHAAVRRLESGDSEIGRWNPHRSGGVGSQRAETKVGGGPGGRTARRSAGDVVQRPGIVHGAEATHIRSSAVSKFVKIKLAEDNGPGVFQSADNPRVLRRNPEQFARRGGADPRSVDIIFQSDRDPVQRPSPFPPPLLGLHFTGGFQSLVAGDCDESVPRRIVVFDSLQASLG